MAKRQRWSEGAIFFIPQSDGLHAVGQVVQRTRQALNSAIVALYDLRRKSGETATVFDLKPEQLIAIQFTTPDLLNNGTWPVVGEGPVANLSVMSKLSPIRDLPELEKSGFIGATITGSGIIRKFLDAFYGLRAWDDWADPNYLDTLLLSPEKKPKVLLLKKD
jgi:hypothetical protein